MKSRALFPLAPLLAALLLIGCSGAETVSPAAVTKDTTCALDGMLLQDFAGPKGQIVYEHGERDFFCDTKEMFSLLLRPEQKKRVVAVFTQDMAKADWKHPEGHWIDAKTAFYVIGSRREGSMGLTIGAFATEKDAQAFASQYGGQVMPFDRISLSMVDLCGDSDKRAPVM